ncbi:unnamed protein product [Schistosoma guineensis]|nr:unnamed protein product [Schistosoma guineensis]
MLYQREIQERLGNEKRVQSNSLSSSDTFYEFKIGDFVDRLEEYSDLCRLRIKFASKATNVTLKLWNMYKR